MVVFIGRNELPLQPKTLHTVVPLKFSEAIHDGRGRWLEDAEGAAHRRADVDGRGQKWTGLTNGRWIGRPEWANVL